MLTRMAALANELSGVEANAAKEVALPAGPEADLVQHGDLKLLAGDDRVDDDTGGSREVELQRLVPCGGVLQRCSSVLINPLKLVVE